MTSTAEPLLISVVIPTYNRAMLLREAMASVRSQTHRPIQLIIVDDGSTDETPKFIAEFAQELESRQRTDFSLVHIRQNNAGVSAARNAGLARCEGSFVQFLDSDDLLHPEKLTRQLACFAEDPLLKVAVANVGQFGPDDRVRVRPPNRWNEREEPLHLFLLSHDFTPLGALYRRDTVKGIQGFPENISYGEDIDLHLRLGLVGAKMHFMPDLLGYQRSHGSRRLTNLSRTVSGEFEREFYLRILRFAESSGLADEPFKRAMAARLMRLAGVHYSNGAMATGAACLQLAGEIDPGSRNLKARVYLSKAGYFLARPCESILSWARRAKCAIYRRFESQEKIRFPLNAKH